MALCSGQRPPKSLPFIPKVTTTNIIIITITTIMIIIIVTNPGEWAMIICRRQCLIVAIDLDLGLGLQALNRPAQIFKYNHPAFSTNTQMMHKKIYIKYNHRSGIIRLHNKSTQISRFCTFNKLILTHTKKNTITGSAYSAQSTSLKEYKLESRAMKERSACSEQ